MRLTNWFTLFLAAAAPAPAQVSEQTQRATISGTGGASGKCTVEVRVDMTAEVDILGDSGRLRTIAGQPASWTRLDCTGPLPYNMTDFRFRGVDGRGRVTLVQDPRNNNSIAVVHIEDPRSGSEGYTFDIEWSGGSGGAATDGFSTSGFRWPPAAGTATATATPPASAGGRRAGDRGSFRDFPAERALDLCRAEVHARAERDYGLPNIDITSVGVDTAQGRRDWVTGSFSDAASGAWRGASYRFNCAMDYNAGQVRSLEILRADGTVVQPGTAASGASSKYDQNQAIRACQDAVVARANRDGYQNVNFGSTLNTSRAGWISGAITAGRGPISDSFDFSCEIDPRGSGVRNLQFTRR